MSDFEEYAPVSDEQLGFFIDSSRCSGCKACQVACKDKITGSRTPFSPYL